MKAEITPFFFIFFNYCCFQLLLKKSGEWVAFQLKIYGDTCLEEILLLQIFVTKTEIEKASQCSRHIDNKNEKY